MTPMIQPIVLCGGPGSRLWPLSRAHEPKPLLPLAADGRTLLEATLLRLHRPGFAPPLVLCREAHRFRVQTICGRTGLAFDLLVEPEGRDTAPAIAAACHHFPPDTRLFLTPSDLDFHDPAALFDAIDAARAVADAGEIVIFGSPATSVQTGLGWIVTHTHHEPVRRVKRFVEKPAADLARVLLDQGGALWHAGMSLVDAGVLANLFAHTAPELDRIVKQALDTAQTLDAHTTRLGPVFTHAPKIAFDHAILEHLPSLHAVCLHTAWRDIGTWASLYARGPHDADGNVLTGDVFVQDCANSLFFSQHRLLTAIGVQDLAVVETADAVLVAPIARTPEVRALVSALANRPEHDEHPSVAKPWGHYDMLVKAERWRCKHLKILAGEAISEQAHASRDEYWIVVEGTGMLTLDGQKREVRAGDMLTLPRKSWHRLEASIHEAIELIEVQRGEKLDESDILRRDDRYHR